MQKLPVLLLGDMTGRSSVAVRLIMQQLEARGHEVLALPTALISNTLNLGQSAQLDTTDYLLRSLAVWRDIGVNFGFVYMGYITGVVQARALCDVADEARVRGIPVLLDPILGDDGRMYRSVTADQAQGMALLMQHADILTPNLTEACLLTDTPYEKALTSYTYMENMAGQLAEKSAAVLITGAKDACGQDAVVGCMRGHEPFAVPFERIPGHFFGTGDRFTSLLIDALVRKVSLKEAVRAASDGVYRALAAGYSLNPIDKV